MAVSGTKLTTLAVIDMQWQKAEKMAKFRILDKVSEGSTIIFEGAQVPLT